MRWAWLLVVVACGAPAEPSAGPSTPPSVRTPPPPATADGPPCGTLSELPLGDVTPLLGGRLGVQPLDGARALARPHGVVGAPATDVDESRVLFDHGPERLSITAWELFASTGADFAEAGARALPGLLDIEEPVAVRVDAPPLRVVAARPRRLDVGADAVLVLGALVARPDGMVQLVAFHVSPAAASAGAGCSELAARLARTLQPGERPLRSEAGERSLWTMSSRQELRLDVPEGWVLVSHPGPDFVAHSGRRIVPLSASTPFFGVYVGDHPSRAPLGEPADERALFGEPVRWTRDHDDRGVRLDARLRFPRPDGSPAFLHLWAVGRDDAQAEAIRAILETLRVEATTGG